MMAEISSYKFIALRSKVGPTLLAFQRLLFILMIRVCRGLPDQQYTCDYHGRMTKTQTSALVF